MILFFDTETTGFYDDRLPLDHEAQPYCVQLAAQLCDHDGSTISGINLILDNGVEIPARAAEVHGITTERAARHGVAPKLAIEIFGYLYHQADLIVAHNAKFDIGVMGAAASRLAGRPRPLTKASFCTMEAAGPIVNLPPTERMVAAGFNKPKPPKLEECIQHFFGEALDGAHDAMIDVAACRRVYFHLKTLEQA
jgi:DNA polymerase-3 subunit epsilon